MPLVVGQLVVDVPPGNTIWRALVTIEGPIERARLQLGLHAAMAVAWCGTTALLVRRAVRARGAARSGAAVLAGTVAVVTALALISIAAGSAINLSVFTRDDLLIRERVSAWSDLHHLLYGGGLTAPLL